ncbi:DNA polymerase III subunit delta [Candidatus Symbiobacter mobilis]|uniref:DNA polymerase III subunit delta n=1 Tax=Candidatus Symbiobacter mobilis CR TaxID=946483 RepID=U5N8X9_9BURK|nr:DNA polymerase III subunit delta [Candidatus Symbiobacter mobilis]AGX88001.1 DNA polymerase III subunit delta [Candidatus Symbiobacter mobilis CR]
MALSPAQLPDHLAGGLRSLYTVVGDDPLLVQECMDSLRAAARAQGAAERERYVSTDPRFDWSAVWMALHSVGLFAPKKILELHVPNGKPGKEGSTALQRLAQDALRSDTATTLVALPRLDKASRGSSWFAALEKGVTIDVPPVDRAQLPKWIAQRLRQQGQRVPAGAEGQRVLDFFADRVEGNLLAAHQEIQKLALLYPQGELGYEQIAEAVLDVARYHVFQLPEAVLAADAQRVQRVLDALQGEGEAVVLVLFTLAEDLRALWRVKEATLAGKALAAALQEHRIWYQKARAFEQLIPRLRREDLGHLVQAAHQVDGITKGLRHPDWPEDPWQAVLQLALRACKVLGRPS